jgi:predicted RNase H-like HicB family nuclease
MQTFTAVIHKEEDMYVAECPEVGTVSQGVNIKEAITNLKEATELYLDEFPLKEERKTLMTTFEVAISAKA